MASKIDKGSKVRTEGIKCVGKITKLNHFLLKASLVTVLIKTGFGTSIVITIFILTKNNEHTLLWGDRVKLVQHKK